MQKLGYELVLNFSIQQAYFHTVPSFALGRSHFHWFSSLCHFRYFFMQKKAAVEYTVFLLLGDFAIVTQYFVTWYQNHSDQPIWDSTLNPTNFVAITL